MVDIRVLKMENFLTGIPSFNQTVTAIRRVKRSWGLANTDGQGGITHRRNGATWILTPSKYAAIFSPRWTRKSAPRELRSIIEYYRENGVQRMICGWIGGPTPGTFPIYSQERDSKNFTNTRRCGWISSI